MRFDLKLLDCTLRDGGYINDWKWGYSTAKDLIRLLTIAQVDVVEVGFLRNVDAYDPNVTVCNTIEELNKLLPDNCGTTMYSAMAMRSNYDISKLSPYCGSGIEMIRITAHDYDIAEGMEFAREVKSRGYKLSINPINIMGYSDEEILWILKEVNAIQPYQFSIVDTFGSMKRRDLDRIVSLVDHNLDRSIRVALHLHENMSLSCCLAQTFVDKHLNRPISVDGSLMGMGRIPGNLPIELIADYLNDYTDKNYDIDFMMDAIQDYIAPLKGETEWGYTPSYFLSARYNLHRNYAEHYLKKGDLTNRDINHILARFDRKKATAFDAAYADQLYEEYKNNQIDDTEDRAALKKALTNRQILLIAPGPSVASNEKLIQDYISEEKPLVISVNFIPENIKPHFAFFSNNKRFSKIIKPVDVKTIVTSNLPNGAADYYLDYNSLSGAFSEGCNSLIMLMKLVKELDFSSVTVAGADGYQIGESNYYNNLRNYTEHGSNFNLAVAAAIKKLDVGVTYLTPSAYDLKEE